MIIETNLGNFGSFADLLRCMTEECKPDVHILRCEYWFAKLPTGHYTIQQISDIVSQK